MKRALWRTRHHKNMGLTEAPKVQLKAESPLYEADVSEPAMVLRQSEATAQARRDAALREFFSDPPRKKANATALPQPNENRFRVGDYLYCISTRRDFKEGKAYGPVRRSKLREHFYVVDDQGCRVAIQYADPEKTSQYAKHFMVCDKPPDKLQAYCFIKFSHSTGNFDAWKTYGPTTYTPEGQPAIADNAGELVLLAQGLPVSYKIVGTVPGTVYEQARLRAGDYVYCIEGGTATTAGLGYGPLTVSHDTLFLKDDRALRLAVQTPNGRTLAGGRFVRCRLADPYQKLQPGLLIRSSQIEGLHSWKLYPVVEAPHGELVARNETGHAIPLRKASQFTIVAHRPCEPKRVPQSPTPPTETFIPVEVRSVGNHFEGRVVYPDKTKGPWIRGTSIAHAEELAREVVDSSKFTEPRQPKEGDYILCTESSISTTKGRVYGPLTRWQEKMPILSIVSDSHVCIPITTNCKLQKPVLNYRFVLCDPASTCVYPGTAIKITKEKTGFVLSRTYVVISGPGDDWRELCVVDEMGNSIPLRKLEYKPVAQLPKKQT